MLLPRAAEVAKSARSSIAVKLVSTAAGGVGGYALIALLDSIAIDLAWPIVIGLVAGGAAMFWLQILVHEAGHACAGLVTGRRLMGAGVGPLRLDRGIGGWRLRWSRSVRGIGGFAVLLPGARGDGRGAAALFLLGGPLANLLTAAMALALLRLLPSPGAFTSLALGITGFCGAVLGIINLMPFRSRGWNSDGHQLAALLRDTPASKVMLVQQRVLALAMSGVRPRDWPVAELDTSEDLPPDANYAASVLRLSWAMDRGDRPAADAAALALVDAHTRAPDGLRQNIATMLASHAARIGDADLLAAWRPLCEGDLLDLSPYRIWLDAEAAEMAGDIAGARALLAQAREALPRIHDPASVVVMGEYLEELEGRLAVG